MEKLVERILTKEWLEKFEITKVREIERGKPEEFENELIVELREKKECKPKDVPKETELESKGFYDPLELIDFPLGGIATYIKFYKRRWRDKKSKKEYQNSYDLRYPKTKLTKRFAIFLKAEDRDKVNQLLCAVPYLHDLIEEDFQMVQRGTVRLP